MSALGTCSSAEISPGFSNSERSLKEPVIGAHPGPLGCGMIRHQCHIALVNRSQAQGHGRPPVSEAVRYGPTCQGRTPCSRGTPGRCDLHIPQRKAGCEGKLHPPVLKSAWGVCRSVEPGFLPHSPPPSATRAKSSCLPLLVTRPRLWFIPRRVSHGLGTIFHWSYDGENSRWSHRLPGSACLSLGTWTVQAIGWGWVGCPWRLWGLFS